MTGLVLEGGGMRGLYTAGVIDIMLDHGFEPDVVCGASAGVTFGINLISKQRGRVLRYNTRYLKDKRYISFHSWLTTGNMINRKFAYGELPVTLDPFDEKTFEASKAEFYATITNMHTGQPEYIKLVNALEQMEVIRATAALPVVCQPVELNGQKYMDGGVADPIPLDKCFELGCDKIVVVLTHPYSFVRKDKLNFWCRLLYPRYKNLLRTFDSRNEDYNRRVQQIMQLELEGKVFVFRPLELLNISRLEKDPARLEQVYNIGLKDAAAQWQALEEYLAK